MTTYTITESEYDQLIKLANKIICAGNGNLPGNSVGNDLGRDVIALLRNLQPNTQEPVATVTDYPTMGVKFSEQSNFGCDLPAGTKLYTRPAAQQKPLTGEQIMNHEMWRSHAGHSFREKVQITRAIEAAHNIGVKP